ncbi:RNA procession exonuclease [Desulfuromonas soudanensis]|uniref:RNA procession exonuclease n=1 Tax=Desulfuromonas soudanensis TaxID=1603606 RepID=A0A0M4CYL8_9BACT|nr:MBL fold metallo-hydrolase [Desulfuromonas soudanensis]ALC15477.1 RNA procession exonuclease [Desulfuromonas soudanensis]
MNQIPIIHHGGRTQVTGSCHELRLADGSGLLIDCGLPQGDDAGSPEIDFPVAQLRALVLTHVHIDHCGRIPYLLAVGFDGPIYCSEPSALLLPEILEDAIRLGITRQQPLIDQLLRKIKKQLRPLPYGAWQQLPGKADLKIRLQPAGHILGSAFIECDAETSTGKKRIVFSGDLGAPYAPLLPAPKAPYRADLLVLESTYGDRLHEGRRERREQLRQVIERALTDLGAILVPAFSIGRTQELLYEIEEIIHRNRKRFAAAGLPWEELEIIVDSPLAGRFNDLYRGLRPYWDAEAQKKLRSGRHPLSFEQLTTVDSHQDHLQVVDYLKRKGRPCVVIAASGMCSGGRIVNYLRALLGDARTDVLFCGYQASGTPGREIQQYGPQGGYVRLDGERVDIRARIHTLSGFSAHADQQNLLNFVKGMRIKPSQIRLVHGEDEARNELAGKFRGMGMGIGVD